MQDMDFDKLLSDYRRSIDNWVTAIKAEEALANDDHSMVEMEKWDAAAFTAHDAEAVAKKARDRYKNESLITPHRLPYEKSPLMEVLALDAKEAP
jgi:hypothetical protein